MLHLIALVWIEQLSTHTLSFHEQHVSVHLWQILPAYQTFSGVSHMLMHIQSVKLNVAFKTFTKFDALGYCYILLFTNLFPLPDFNI